jgi:hypothetical protein
MIINNTGLSSIKIFCESKTANVSLHNSRKIWQLNTPIVLNNTTNKMLCSVESCSIPLSYYTINDTNNSFKFNGVADSLTNGNYNANQIVIELNKIAPFTFSFNTFTSKFVITGVINVTYTIDEVKNSIYNLLGLVPNVSFLAKYVAPNVCNLVYTSGIYLNLNGVENNNIDTGTIHQSSTCLVRLPINQPTNTYLQYFNNIGFKNLLSTQVLSQIDVSLLDDNRQLLELSDNVNWTIVLRIDFERIILETVETTKINKMKSEMNNLK